MSKPTKSRNTWGGTTKLLGFSVVSRAFLRTYVSLGITYEEAMLILHIMDYMWHDNIPPWPSVANLARHTGRNPEVLRRYLRSLRAKGFLETKAHTPGGANEYDFSPLFAAVERTVREGNMQRIEPDPDELARRERMGQSYDDLPTQRTPAAPKLPNRNVIPSALSHPALYPSPPPSVVADPPTEKGDKEHAIPKNNQNEVQFLRGYADAQNAKGAASTRVPVSQGPRKTKNENRPREANTVPTKWGTTEALTLWRTKYLLAMTLPYGSLTMKERAQMKAMVNEYGPTLLPQVIDGFLTRWVEFCDALGLRGSPTIAALYGYRKSVVPAISGQGVLQSRRGSQYHGTDTSGLESF